LQDLTFILYFTVVSYTVTSMVSNQASCKYSLCEGDQNRDHIYVLVAYK